MKIYTKTGDDGSTMLFGGGRVPKHHVRIEAYGTVDELNSWMGLLRDVAKSENDIAVINEIQHRLFTIGAILATDPKKENVKPPDLFEKDIKLLEDQIDQNQEQLEELKNFILPGGHQSVSYAHISRCVCRRAERIVTQLDDLEGVDSMVIHYLNRLSDYLFVLARKFGMENESQEIKWMARAND